MALTLYGFPLSGHSHRAELMLNLLGLDYQAVHVDLAKGEQKEADFLALNRFGAVPVLRDDDFVIADSNAILVYLALRYDPKRRWLPEDARRAAEVERFLSVAQGPVRNGPAMARVGRVFGAKVDFPACEQIAANLFAVLEAHLPDRVWLVGEAPTIADVSCYSYIAHAPEGGIALEPFPAIRAWLGRVEALPGFVPMPKAA
jgi:glutathione S-transferase